ncbi:L-seryl-tRNA(Sec) kinase-like [Anopheles albimanus]|uniref:L-seryl-tRNA(Sec) kinase-like n=1 Tax=Anopheles albimanus TaxID=7167 RepID=UPI0016408924|nr:L-seryl-tRNA(Sec) kinase-like [Anopheles albimanus]
MEGTLHKMTRICLNVLIGIPASGKTTYCAQMERAASEQMNVVHVCYDTFVPIDTQYDQFHDEAGSYKRHRQHLLSSVEAIIVSIRNNDHGTLERLLQDWVREFKEPLKLPSPLLHSKDYLFLIDDNMYYRSMRMEWLQVARRRSLGFFGTFFDVPLELALQRNQSRERPIPEATIRRMWMRLENPCSEVYGWEQNIVSIDGTLEGFNEILSIARHCFEKPEQMVNIMPSTPMEQSVIHQIDLLLRKAISERMALAKNKLSKSDLRTLASVLQERKLELLQRLRNGDEVIADDRIHCVNALL